MIHAWAVFSSTFVPRVMAMTKAHPELGPSDFPTNFYPQRSLRQAGAAPSPPLESLKKKTSVPRGQPETRNEYQTMRRYTRCSQDLLLLTPRQINVRHAERILGAQIISGWERQVCTWSNKLRQIKGNGCRQEILIHVLFAAGISKCKQEQVSLRNSWHQLILIHTLWVSGLWNYMPIWWSPGKSE